jgi:glycosyltransferase involved in cell wall biosynthesis
MFASFQMKVISRYTSGVIFITENEKSNFIELSGSRVDGKVIYNIVPNVEALLSPLEEVSSDRQFKVCILSNYAYLRGTDQLIDVAIKLQEMGQEKVLFVVAGDLSLSRSLPGKLGEVARKGGNLSDYAVEMGVEDMFLFLGYVKDPERVLSDCHVLICPSREYNPWGRDVLEALSFGLPVIATGTYNRFVENRVTGFLLDEFDPKKVADCIVELFQNEQLVKHMGEQGKKRVQELCNGPDRARDLQNFWQKIVEQ